MPPEKPKNLSCIVNEGKKMMCQWDPGRETHLETNYTLKSEWQVILNFLYIEFIKFAFVVEFLSCSIIKCKVLNVLFNFLF